MKRLVLALTTSLAFASSVAAEKIPLADISAYLNNLQTATGEFTQINADGTIATGKIYIKRPGRVRFEYNPPDQTLVMAGGGSVAIFDPKSNEPPQRYPLNQTPLSIILERDVDLARANMVTGHISDDTTTTIRAQDPENPEYGSIDLVFTGGDPVQLRQWVINDGSGTQTTVILGDLDTYERVPNRLFNILAETRARGN